MARHSWYVLTLFLIAVIVIVYSLFVFIQNQTSLLLAVVLIWAILLPIISDLPYSAIYLVSLPAPFFGTLFGLMSIMQKYFELSIAWFLLAGLISLFLVLGFHKGTRKRAMFWKFHLSSISRLGIATSSVIFLMLALAIIYPSALSANPQNELFYFSAAILGYLATSMLYINSSYRYYTLCNRVGTQNIEKLLEEKWKNIEKKFLHRKKDVDVLRYYFNESFTSFIEGNFEKSFIWGYNVIREETVVNPKEIIDDKRNGKPSFADIRNTLLHSRRGDTHVEAEKLKRTLKNLGEDTIDLLEREITFIKIIAKPSANAIEKSTNLDVV